MGACAALKCPHCHTENRFNLHVTGTTFTVLSVALHEFGRVYQFCCSNCEYRKDIADQEASSVMEAATLFSKLEAGTFTATEYAQMLARLECASLKELLAAAAFWTCPRCAEEVPANFNECWKCKAGRPNLEASSPPESFAAPKFHPHITRPANPWE